MTIPNLLNINAFDATLEHTVKFTWNGNQSNANTCVIRNNETNEIVYSNTQTTYKLEHIIPANTLQNGVCYNIQISVTDIIGEQSSFSNQGIFYCYTTPSFYFSNLLENNIIQNSSFEWELSYSQSEGEKLNEYQVYLYDAGRSLINQTNVKYNITNSSIFKAYFSNLEDNGRYYARATGTTLNGITLDTGYIPFSVEYEMNNLYSYVWLENDYKKGYIKIQSNIKVIDGTSNPDPPIYIDNKEIDLRKGHPIPDPWVKFHKGFTINGDFTLQIIGRNFDENSEIMEMSNGINTINLYWMKGDFEGKKDRYYVNLKAYNNLTCYSINSNLIDNPNDNKVQIFLQRKDNVYWLKIKNLMKA